MTDKTFITIWEAPKVTAPEFRLYYDEAGRVICYTGDKLDGNFIVVDAKTFAEGRPDVRVVDGNLATNNSGSVISKLIPNELIGQACAAEDISMIVDENEDIVKQYWKLTVHKL